MGLKMAWSVKDYHPCCGNCIHMFEKSVLGGLKVDFHGQEVSNAETRFFCKVGVKIEKNHWTFMNISTCVNHRFNKQLKSKKRITKKKHRIIVKKQNVKRTIIKFYLEVTK